MAIKKKIAKTKAKKKKTKPAKKSRKKLRTKKKVVTKKSATKKRSKKTRITNKLKTNKREVKKMSTETIKSDVSASLDTSHLKVPFPYKKKYGNYINGKFVEPLSGKYFDNVSPINNFVIYWTNVIKVFT